MNKLDLENDIKPLSDFRANAALYVKQIKNSKRPIILTQHGKSTAVLLDVKEYQSLLNKIDVLQDIQLAEQQIDEGHGIDHKKVKNLLLNKYPE
jgi:antitoxin YefM